jgi:O-6-methylguanine DNA methyltransferase
VLVLIKEWIPAERLNCTVEVQGEPEGWIERVDLVPGETEPWDRGYELWASREILEYVRGQRRGFSHEDQVLNRLELIRGRFHRAVLLRTMKIPYGETMAYSQVAGDLGSNAWRAAGTALANNPIPLLVPCHRVVAKHGIGGFGECVWLKRNLLQLEGADVP